ncbi:alpha/beta fold hydrolase [Acerihabitans sp. TG2]|uniref:dienelactone hydrolase family protein n=1 Tax=Acerihabitans sp. TG2 TaxID=3096008 RepID=UPI002B239B50|nr:alpha/beta fold hydrolase [Acerihabitans sp. TG2]MEA9389742.1 alpha/beta fold hydrolase [Acerihabitans sp. TG2]
MTSGIFTRTLVLAVMLTSGALQASPATYQTSAITSDNLPVFYPQLKQQMTFQDSWLAGKYHDFSVWRTQTRKILRQALLTPDSTIAFAAETLDQQDRGSYLAKKIALNITDESRIQGILLTPKSHGPHPAIVLLHDHGSKFDIGKEKMIRPWGNPAQLASAQAWSEKFFSGKFVGDELAKRGYVVFAIDALGWGDRGPMTYEQQQALASNFFNLGRSLAGNMAYEDMRTVDFVATLPSVDRHRIGVVGFSMGAYRAWQLAALSDKVAVTAAISWFGSYQGLMTPGNNVLRGQSAFYMLHPGIANKLDFPDIASLAAPKPMLLFNGGKDKLFPQTSVEQAYAKVHTVWRSQQADARLMTRIWPALGHVFYKEQQDVVFPWLDHWLKP